MGTLENLEIRKLISEKNLKYKEIAARIGICPEHMSRVMRYPLKPEMQARIVAAIDDLPGKKDDRKLLKSFGRELGIPNAPMNILRYMRDHHCNLQVNINTVDVECSYGRRIVKDLRIMRPYEECTRCGYHSLYRPDDSGSKCLRHTYKKGYDTVFCYTEDDGEKKSQTLEQAFDAYLKQNEREDYGAAVVPLFV